jgi:HEAT repeat protein
VHAVEPLIGALKDSDWAVRHNAASALGDIGTAAIGPLMAALKGPNSVAPQDVLEA